MEKGFSTLLVVIILGTLATSLIIYITTTSFWAVRGSIDNKHSVQAQQTADACAELALEAIRESKSCAVSGNASIGDSSCTYNSSGSLNCTINVISNNVSSTRKLQIITSGFNPVTITSWHNVQ